METLLLKGLLSITAKNVKWTSRTISLLKLKIKNMRKIKWKLKSMTISASMETKATPKGNPCANQVHSRYL